MRTTVPFSKLLRSQREVTEAVELHDVVLDRRDADDLYLSTLERHDREMQAQRITTDALAALARTRPDIAGEVMTASLPWLRWLTGEDKADCLQELLDELRAGADTGELRPFFRALDAWKSSAVIASDPELVATLQRDTSGDDMSEDERVVEVPVG